MSCQDARGLSPANRRRLPIGLHFSPESFVIERRPSAGATETADEEARDPAAGSSRQAKGATRPLSQRTIRGIDASQTIGVFKTSFRFHSCHPVRSSLIARQERAWCLTDRLRLARRPWSCPSKNPATQLSGRRGTWRRARRAQQRIAARSRRPQLNSDLRVHSAPRSAGERSQHVALHPVSQDCRPSSLCPIEVVRLTSGDAIVAFRRSICERAPSSFRGCQSW